MQVALLAFLFVISLIGGGCKAEDIRVALFDWAGGWDYEANTFGPTDSLPDLNEADGGITAIMEAQFYLGMMAFNDRNAEILPILGTLGTCNKNITIPYFCNTGGNPRVALGDFLELAQLTNSEKPHAIVGPVRSAEATSMAMASSVLGSIPLISHWATSMRLADKAQFPQFMRTVPSDFASVVVLNRFIRKMGWKHVYLVFESSDFGAGWKEALFSEVSKDSVTLKFSAFDNFDFPSILSAMDSVRESKINIVILVAVSLQLNLMAKAWKESGLEAHKPLIIFASLDSTFDLISRADSDTDLARMAHASLSLQVDIPVNSRWTDYKARWSTGFFNQYESIIRERFPPNGLGNSPTGCANAAFTYEFPVGLLGAEHVDKAYRVWAWAFDSVIAIGLAACRLSPTGPLPTTFTENLYAEMVNLDFEGLSGRVKFDNLTGDRDVTTSGFLLTNYLRLSAGNDLNPISVGEWSTDTGAWVMTANIPITYPRGVGAAFISDIVVPEHERNYLSSGWKAWGFSEVVILNALCISCLVWLVHHKKDKIVINSQGPFLQVMVVGCMIASWSILALTVDDAPDDYLNEDVACNASFILFSLGFQLALLAIIVKVYRILFIFQNANKMRKGSSRIGPLLALIGFLMTVEIVILVVWVIVAPLKWERLVKQTDEFGSPLVSVGQCAGGTTSVIFMCIVFSFHAISLVLTSVVSNRVRDLPVEYQESKYINLAIMSMLQIYVISVPAVVASYGEVVGRFVIMTSVVFVTVGALVLFLIGPKMFPKYFEVQSISPSHPNLHSSPGTSSPANGGKRIAPTSAGVRATQQTGDSVANLQVAPSNNSD